MYQYTDDISYAKDVCLKKKNALAYFTKSKTDRSLWIAKKWSGHRDNHMHFKIQKVSGETINTTDSMMDTYVWILKRMIKASCNYKGIKNAKFETYMWATINHPHTFNDWLKSKYGNTSYIPKIIRSLSTIHQEIFIMLRRKKDINQIASKLELIVSDVEYLIKEIQYILHINNKGNMLSNNILKKSPFENLNEENIENKVSDYEDIGQLSPEGMDEFQAIYNTLGNCFIDLSQSDRRLLLLYWGEQMSTSQIIELINNDKTTSTLNKFKISNQKDLYKCIDDIIKKVLDDLNKNHSDFYSDYQISKSIVSNALKVLIMNFEIQQS